ncbi:hypothetical protein LSUE1_G002836 [Lachnellula suecica]|uniref:NB-ARC domain-containing protein n=1 Tax=Lachnellula suecica TaxID=602035 RepID=A0A8T9CBG5_9HELO|nr:hypothetical protein LSUE1_G002836 [Lachnellula suecica]
MADPLPALGAAATALQMVELGGNIIKFTYELYSKIEEAPQQIQRQLAQIKQIIKICELIARDEGLQKDSIASMLGSCILYAREFQRLLLQVPAEKGDGSPKRKRKAVEAVMKEKEVAELFVNLEREKSSLALSIADIDSAALYSIGVDINGLKSDIGDVSVVVRDTAQGAETVKTLLLKMNQRVSEVADPIVNSRSFYLVPNGRASNFIGREDILSTIESSFSSELGPNVVVLRGLGGQGKTQIALEYCRRSRETKFQSIFWINANSESTVKNSFEAIAEEIKEPERIVSEAKAVNYVLDALRKWPDTWLMVFDNYDDVDNFGNIQDFLPESENGCVIVTSRHLDSLSLATSSENAIDLPGLAESDALELLHNMSDLNQTESSVPGGKAVVELLGYHALAITQAGSYIKRRKIPLDQFVTRINYDKRAKDILQYTPEISQYRRSLSGSQQQTSLNVFTTWELSFEMLLLTGESGQEKGNLLTLIAFSGCNDVSEELFSNYCGMAQQAPEAFFWPVPYLDFCLDETSQWNSEIYQDILVDLASMSLLQSWSLGEDGFAHCNLHPLVQDWIRLHPEGLNSIKAQAQALGAEHPRNIKFTKEYAHMLEEMKTSADVNNERVQP